MKKLFVKLLGIILVFGMLQPVWAYDYCDPDLYVVFHINGINTTKLDAQRNRDALAEALPETLNGKRVKIHLAYNVTRGYLTDLADTFEQKKNEFPGSLLRNLSTFLSI